MIFQFITGRNEYGHRKYLFIDTDRKVFSRNCNSFFAEGIQIKKADYKELVNRLQFMEFKEF